MLNASKFPFLTKPFGLKLEPLIPCEGNFAQKAPVLGVAVAGALPVLLVLVLRTNQSSVVAATPKRVIPTESISAFFSL